MLVVISPAKKLDMDVVEGIAPTAPAFNDRAVELAKVARKLKVKDLQGLMHISENLAKLNAGSLQRIRIDGPQGRCFGFCRRYLPRLGGVDVGR